MLEVDAKDGLYGRVQSIQEERAWVELMRNERRIQDRHARANRAGGGDERRGRLWAGGSVHGSYMQASHKPSRAPFAEDSEVWRRDMVRRDENSGRRDKHKELNAMHTRDLIDIQRRAARELERREWRQAVDLLNTRQLSAMSELLQEKLEVRQGKGMIQPPRTPPSPPRTPPFRHARAGQQQQRARR